MAITALLVIYWKTAVGMVEIWYRSETFTHAFVVPPIVLWLAWRRREELVRMVPVPAPIMLLPMALMAFLWLLGDLSAVNSVTQFAWVAMLVLTIPVLWGIRVAHVLVFPLFFMFFCVPIGEFLLPVFMDWTADFTVAALRLTGVPVLREGLQFVIPSGNWSVVEACSGIRYLIASVTVGALFAHLNFQSPRRRMVFVLISILVPVIANWLRAYMIVMLGHVSGNTIAVGVDHLIYGWVFFGVVIGLMFLIGARWAEPDPLLATAGKANAEQVSAAPSLYPWSTTGLLLVLLTLPVGSRWLIDGQGALANPTLITPQSLGSNWQVRLEGPQLYKPKFDNPSAELNASYASEGKVIGLYLAFYRQQNYNRKLVSSTHGVGASADPEWARVSIAHRPVSIGTAMPVWRTVELRQNKSPGTDQSSRLVVWQIYWINGTLTANDYLAKVYSAMYRLLGRGDDCAAIVVYAEKSTDGAANRTLESFLTANYGQIDALLRQAMVGN